jgi:hypothetical protein
VSTLKLKDLQAIDQIKFLVFFLMDVKQGPLNWGLEITSSQLTEAFRQLNYGIKVLWSINELSDDTRNNLLAYLTEVEYNIHAVMEGQVTDFYALYKSGEYTYIGVDSGFRELKQYIDFIKIKYKV